MEKLITQIRELLNELGEFLAVKYRITQLMARLLVKRLIKLTFLIIAVIITCAFAVFYFFQGFREYINTLVEDEYLSYFVTSGLLLLAILILLTVIRTLYRKILTNKV